MRNGWLLKWQRLLFGKGQAAKTKDIFRSLFHCAADAYFVYSKETQEIIEVNETAGAMFEMPATSPLKGLYMSQIMMRFLTIESPNLEFLLNNLSETWKGEAEFKTHKKNKFYSLVNIHNVTVSEQEAYWVMSIRNISDSKKVANELANSRLNTEKAIKTKAKFLSSMSHELRTPLNGIIGSSDLILSEPALDEEVKRHVQVIKYSSEHMLSIINDILSFSKLNAEKVALAAAPFPILKCLQNITASFQLQYKTKGVKFTCYFPKELEDISVNTDELKLSQVIHNLLSNALKFTDFGSVCFSVKMKEISDSEITLFFEIKDTGIGISSQYHEEIFNAFSQVYADDHKRRYGGTGLGLAISRQLVQLLGGNLELESELQKGSRFFFTCKFKIEQQVSFPKNEEPLSRNTPSKDIRGIRVLVVEDNEINAKILKSFLSKWQMQIKAAITGVHAVELVKYHKFDLILMDLEMPEMNGYTALKVIRERNIDTPVIAFTATQLENLDSLITEAGFTDYIVKPFKPDDLKKKIEMYCERKIDYA